VEVVAVELRLGVAPVLPVVDDRTWILQSLLVVLVERVEPASAALFSVTIRRRFDMTRIATTTIVPSNARTAMAAN
jgi:hypothetical protein